MQQWGRYWRQLRYFYSMFYEGAFVSSLQIYMEIGLWRQRRTKVLQALMDFCFNIKSPAGITVIVSAHCTESSELVKLQ